MFIIISKFSENVVGSHPLSNPSSLQVMKWYRLLRINIRLMTDGFSNAS